MLKTDSSGFKRVHEAKNFTEVGLSRNVLKGLPNFYQFITRILLSDLKINKITIILFMY